MSTEAGLGHGSLETVLAAHERTGSVRRMTEEECTCGEWVDAHRAHVAEQVRGWLREELVSPEVVEAGLVAAWSVECEKAECQTCHVRRAKIAAAIDAAAAETLGAT